MHRLLQNPKARIYVALIALLTLSAITLWPGISGPFLFDDESNIPKSFISELSWDEISAATLANNSGPLKRPVSAFSFAITQYFTGEEADGFKLHNIFIHLLTGLVLFFLSRRIFSALKLNQNQQFWGAILCTSFWLLHPLHISTVLYPVQRMAQLATLFSFIAIYSYLKGRQCPHQQNNWFFITLPASIFLAIFSKENVALIPLYLLFIELILFKFINKNNNALKTCWALFILLPLCLAAIYLVSHLGLFNHDRRSFSLAERLYSQQWILLDYLKMIVIPNINDMGIFHDDFSVIKSWQQVLPATLLHLTLITIALYCYRKAALVTLGIAWFYCGHIMESTALPLELIFEHRNYFPLAGIAIIFGGIISQLNHKLSIRLLAFILLSHLALSSYERASFWGHSTKLYQHNASNHPMSARAHIAYANQLLLKKEFDLAIQLLLKAAKLNPNDGGALLHIIKVGCFGPLKYSDDFYPKLTNHYNQNPLTPYGQQALHQITYLFIQGNCNDLNQENFLSVIDAISKQSNSVRREAEMLQIKARIASRSDLTLANKLYKQSYELHQEPRLLSEQATILIAGNKKAEAYAITSILFAQQDQYSPTLKRELKDLLAWHQRQTPTTGDKP